jgi:hypothetical protein
MDTRLLGAALRKAFLSPVNSDYFTARGDDNYFTVSGFHEEEYNDKGEISHQWTSEKEAEMFVRSDKADEEGAGFYIVKLGLSCAVENEITITVKDQQFCFNIFGDDDFIIPLSAEYAAGGIVCLSIAVQRLFCPAEEPGWNSSDTRQLGVSVRSVKMLSVYLGSS